MDYSLLKLFLERLLKQLSSDNIAWLRQLGSELGEEALVENEESFVQVAIAAYSLAKFLEKPHFTRSPDWRGFRQSFLKKILAALEAVESSDARKIRKELSSLVEKIEKASSLLGRFQTSVVEKARLKIAADIYAHGASLGKAAELSGAGKRQLLSYIGATKLAEKYGTLDVSQRLGRARKLFE